MSKAEKLGYPTQKPLKLLERIIECSTKEGDLVLDPFCGCGTTLIASENLGRKWVGMDLNRESYDLTSQRIKDEKVKNKLCLIL